MQLQFWKAQIQELLVHLTPEQVKKEIASSISSDHPDFDQIMNLVDEQLTVSSIASFVKQASPMYEIWVNVKGKQLLYSRPKTEREKTQHINRLLHEQKRSEDDILVREAQSFDYVGFGQDQAQSNFATPNSEGETGPGTAVPTEGLQGPGGSYWSRALNRKERIKKKRQQEQKLREYLQQEEEEEKEDSKKRRAKRVGLITRIAQSTGPRVPRPGNKLDNPGLAGNDMRDIEDTVEDARKDIQDDIKDVSNEIEDTRDRSENQTKEITDNTTQTTQTVQETSDTVKQISDETEQTSNDLQQTVDQTNQTLDSLNDTIDKLI